MLIGYRLMFLVLLHVFSSQGSGSDPESEAVSILLCHDGHDGNKAEDV